MSWLQLHLIVDKAQTARVELLLEALGALSISIDDAADEALLEPAPGESPLWRSNRVTGLFTEQSDRARLENRIRQSLDREIADTLQWASLKDRQWERAWLDDFRPMKFGQRLWICPNGERPAQQSGLFIDLDPGLAFGTGTHPTTALCLNWLDRQRLNGLRVIDFGCGSGILSIAALKLGADEVIAVDHDPQALEASRANGKKNGVLERLHLVHSEVLLPVDKADLILANILAGTLIELEPKLAKLLHSGGRIILSGLLVDQIDKVSTAYATDFDLLTPVIMDNWVLLEGRRH